MYGCFAHLALTLPRQADTVPLDYLSVWDEEGGRGFH